MFVADMKQVRWAMKASYSAEKLKTCIKKKIEVLNRPTFPSIFFNPSISYIGLFKVLSFE